MTEYATFLSELGKDIRKCASKHILGGDFNAKSTMWGSPATNLKGEVERWAVANRLVILNSGSVPTCVRHQGESIVDLTWVTPGLLARIDQWIVDEVTLSLSDHKYIRIQIRNPLARKNRSDREVAKNIFPRWSTKNTDVELFKEVVEWGYAVRPAIEDDDCIDSSNRFQEIITDAANVALKRVKQHSLKKQAYWWDQTLDTMRKKCLTSRRRWYSARKKSEETEIRLAEGDYRRKKKRLRHAILRAKETAWKSLLSTMEQDPWDL